MFDVIKQSIFAGLGLASLAREKAEELAAEVARRAKLSQADADDFRKELMQRCEAAQHDLREEIDRRINHAFIQAGIVKGTLKKAGEEGSREVTSFIDAQIEEALRQAGVARTSDIQSLTERVERLERRLASTPEKS